MTYYIGSPGSLLYLFGFFCRWSKRFIEAAAFDGDLISYEFQLLIPLPSGFCNIGSVFLNAFN